MKTILLYSGGIDSTVLLYDLLKKRWDVKCVGFDYGQTHFRELQAAREITEKLGVSFEVIHLSGVFGASSLVGAIGSVVVPNRNLVFIALAASIAVSEGFPLVMFGATADDYDGFPDCRPAFINQTNIALAYADIGIEVQAPYIGYLKAEVVNIGRDLGVPFAATWSCYAGGAVPCNVCDACKKRNEALK